MAVVYKAWDTTANRYVAIKVLLPRLADDHDFVERFYREAKAAQRLDHPNIVHVHEISQQGDFHYMVMDYVEGESLQQKLKRDRSVSLETALSIVNQIGAALDYAHAQGLVHRDVKPSNILLKDDGQAFLSDFGIAKAVTGTRLTQTGVSLGTPEYMSPEQALGRTLDGRSDLYGLGIVLYEMLTGHVPFQAETTASVLYRQVYTPPPMPTLLNPRLPAHLNQVILKALAKEPGERYQSGHEMAAAMLGSLEAPTQAVARPMRRRLMSPVVLGLASVAVVALLVLMVVVALPRGGAVQSAASGVTGSSTLPLMFPTATVVVVPPTGVPSPVLTSTPTAIPASMPTFVPSPTPTPIQVPYFFDDFQGNVDGQPFDVTRWTLLTDKATGPFTAVQEKGHMKISVTSGNQFGGIVLVPSRYAVAPLERIGVFQSKIMLGSDLAGDFADLQMRLQTQLIGADQWQAPLWAINRDATGQTRAQAGFFSCCFAQGSSRWDTKLYDTAIKTDEWHTYRVEVNWEKGEYSFLMDGANVGTVVSTDQVWRTATTSVIMTFWTGRGPGASGSIYIDDVFISDVSTEVPPTPTR